MPSNSAERVADGLWRRLRPFVVDFISAAMTEPEPVADEDSYIADRAAAQLERHRARLRQSGQAQGAREAAATRKAQ